MTNIEKKIVLFFNKPRSKSLDFLSELISNIKFLIFCWTAVVVYTLTVNTEMGIDIINRLIMVFIVHYFVSELIIKFGAKKLAIKRDRPYVKYPKEIRGLGHNFSDSSFPSSHVSSVVGGLVILYSSFPAAWPALIVFALLLSLSRLHNGMHYPSDILAGVILGLLYGNIVLFLV